MGRVNSFLALLCLNLVLGVPTPAFPQGVVLDHFESGMRPSNSGLGLWNMYTGEGASGPVSISQSAKRHGPNGLQATLNAGTMYLEFYPNDGAVWNFANQRLVSGPWARDTYNRLSFWVFHPSSMPEGSGNSNNIEFGTYVRCETCDPTSAESGGDHYYHYFNVLPGVWTYVIVDNHPQHRRGGGSTSPGVLDYPTTTGPGWNYFDALTRFYWNAPYISPTSYPANFFFDTFQFYRDPNPNEDVANISSLEASFNPVTNTLHIGFCRNASEDPTADTTYTARYAFSDIWQLGFSNATLMGSTGPEGNGDYVRKKIESTTIDLTGRNVVYIAVQKQGRSTFRQIALPLNFPVAPTNLRLLN